MLSDGKINKKELFLKALETHAVSIFVINHPELKMPIPVNESQGIVLNYSFTFPVPIPDLKIDDTGISATLSFNRIPCATFVPWDAVAQIAVVGSFNVTFIETIEKITAPQEKPVETKPRRPKLSLLS